MGDPREELVAGWMTSTPGIGSFASDRCAMKIGPCPQCPESDGCPSKLSPLRWAASGHAWLPRPWPDVTREINAACCAAPAPPSVKPDTDGFHDLANTLDFLLEDAIKFVRTAAFSLNSNDRKLVDYVGLFHDCARLRGNFLHDSSRGAHTGINPQIRCKVKSRNELGNSGQVPRLGRAPSAVAREQR